MPPTTVCRVRRKPKLLVVGDAVATTGFATVTRNLCRRLLPEFEIHQLGSQYYGDPHQEKWKIYPAYPGGEETGIGRIKAMLDLKPDIVFFVGGPWGVCRFLEELREHQGCHKVVVYCAVDVAPVDVPSRLLDGIDRLVAYTEFGRRTLKRCAEAGNAQRPDTAGRLIRIDVIPHGVDTKVFHPFSGMADPRLRRARAIRRLFGSGQDPRDAFIVLNANRNHPRKRIDVTIKGFSLFARDKPENVKLYLHMGTEENGWDIVRLAERHGLRGRLLLTSREKQMFSVSEARLNTIYNAAAVGLNTSFGEGWGLVSFEHAATRAAQIVPRHTSCEELWRDAALLVEPVMSLTIEGILAEMKIVSPEGVAEALDRLYGDPALLDHLAELAYQNATRPEYQWSCIARRWSRLFWEVLGESPAVGDGDPLFHAA